MGSSIHFVIFSALFFFDVLSVGQDGDCRQLVFPQIFFVANKRLVNHTIKTEDVPDMDYCEWLCYKEPNCVSVNFETEAQKCELNNATHRKHGAELEDNDSFLYHGADSACETDHCQNGGVCQSGYTDKGYRCVCLPGFTSDQCEQDIDECSGDKNNCDLNAICTNIEGSYNCTCKEGFVGDGRSCTHTDECLKSPCHNGATCVNKPGSYECECISGYHGKHCGIDIDECQNSSCKNGATCVKKLGSFECRCVRGYQGKHCNIDVNECLNNPCLNGATCINKPGSYECKCASGYHGNNCHIDTNECQNSPCQNGATCVNKPGRYECKCIVGYNGKNCDTDIDECLSNPCQNNGNCPNTIGNYTCKCVQGFEGKNCERDIDECKESSPCQNGTCENKNGTYKCKCQKGFLGLNCEIEELGCFKDKAKDRTMGDHMLESLRKYIDWRDMSKTVRNCSEIAKRKKKYYFAIQFYGECWGASADTQYNKHGPSDNCWSGVGRYYTNFVYRNTDV
ncbi:fibropellin-1-like isoform X4 [Montipora foliosa]|uniref:fibropellin-1-like isoform X4 n=1 Tax=Montipora foliosa TaxID=591990 RepID=UPI0035F19A9A